MAEELCHELRELYWNKETKDSGVQKKGPLSVPYEGNINSLPSQKNN